MLSCERQAEGKDCIYAWASALPSDMNKTGQTVTVSFVPNPGDYGFEWITTNPTLELSSAGTKCNVKCNGKFSGTATVTCSYKFKVGNSYTPASKSWSFTYNTSGDDDNTGGGGTQENYSVSLSTNSIDIQEFETASVAVNSSLDDIKWSVSDTSIASIEPKYDGFLLEVTGLKPGTTYARVSGKYMYNQIIEGLVCINVSKKNYQDGETVDYKTDDMHLRFEVINGKERTASLNSVEGLLNNSKLTVPSQIKGLTVVQVGKTLSSSNTSSKSLNLSTYRNTLQNVTLPETLTTISSYAFAECSSLEQINLPNSVTNIEDGAFMGCKKLTEIHLPNNLNEIGRIIFANCASLKKISINEGIKKIGDEMFYYCSSIESINCPESLEIIGGYCFMGCSNLKSIYINSNLKLINSFAFSRCNNLTNVYISDLSSWCKISQEESYLLSGTEKNLIYENECIESLVIPSDVDKIGKGTFQGYSKLKSVYFPNNLKEIESNAFRNCSGLTEITLENSTPPNITEYTFSSSSYEKVNVIVPDNAVCNYSNHPIWCNFKNICSESGETSSDEFFYQGVNYVVLDRANKTCMTKPGVSFVSPGSSVSGNLTIPSSVKNDKETFRVTAVGEYSFFMNDNISSVTLPNSIKEIGVGAFYDCNKLSSVIIPEGVEKIEVLAFAGSNLSSIALPSSLTYIGGSSFSSCSLHDIVIPENVRVIGDEAFLCKNLENITVDVNNNYFSSSEGVLFDKSKETLICFPEGKTGNYTIPNSVRTIKYHAFLGCRISSIWLSDSLITIEDYAFANFEFEKIFYNSQKPVKADNSNLKNYVLKNATLYVPAGAISTFKETEPWKNFAKIEAYDFNEYPSLNSISEAIDKAALLENREYSEPYVVNFEPIVSYTNGAYNYIVDDGEYFLIYQDNLGLEAGKTVNKGWAARLHNYNDLLELVPLEDATVTNGEAVGIPEPLRIENVRQINKDVMNAVVYIPNIVLTEATPDNKDSFTGKLGNQFFILYNQYGLPSMPAGTYDIMATVGRYYDQLQIQPIEYINTDAVYEINIEEETVYFDMQGNRVSYPQQGGIYIRKQNQRIEKVIIPQ